MRATNQEIQAMRELAKEEGKTEIELLSLMQSAAAKGGNEKTLNKLCAIKEVFIEELMTAAY